MPEVPESAEAITEVLERLWDEPIYPEGAKQAWLAIMHPRCYFEIPIVHPFLWMLAKLAYSFGYWLHRLSGAPTIQWWLNIREEPVEGD